MTEEESPEISIVIPCLNEEESLGFCLKAACDAIRENELSAEIIVADNGSIDDSRSIAEKMGARVVEVPDPGYGSALMGGIEEARGKLIIMGDADGSYDFGEIPKFIEKFHQGFELIQGCRLPSGEGVIMPKAMPFLHRWVGNPFLSALHRLMFRSDVKDIYCGMRAFTPEFYQRAAQRCTGMEFAVEMIVKASMLNVEIAQVPITLHPDQRQSSSPHLRTFRDGWRTVRYFLLSSPSTIYTLPGFALILAGVMGYILAFPGTKVFGATLGVHTLMVATVSILCGYQALLIGTFAKTFAVTEGLIPEDPLLNKFYKFANLELGIILSALLFIIGASLIFIVFREWQLVDYKELDYHGSMRLVIPGTLLMVSAFQTFLSSFFISILGMGRR